MAASPLGRPLPPPPPAQPEPGNAATSSSAVVPDLPSIAALFLVDFDVKAGYTIIWKRAIPNLELEGVVEYKSLPSGLHTVSDDLIYFVHQDGFAGLSAFVNSPTDDAGSRHTCMVAVGVLVPLSYGRLGRAWRHAESLKAMAAALAVDRTETHLLDEYWARCGRGCGSMEAPEPVKDSPLASPVLEGKRTGSRARDRSASIQGGALIQPEHSLSPFHPAWSLGKLLDTFGPLIFPIHRAALVRKRILISTHAPVNETCNFVYNISMLANIPLSVFELLEPWPPAQRLRPLFTVGVHDIPFLTADKANTAAAERPASSPEQRPCPLGDPNSGWIACTTDSILATKEDLWDVLITLWPAHAACAQKKIWPTIESPKGVPVKATQRDLRRFRTLKAVLRRTNATTASAPVENTNYEPSTSTTAAAATTTTTTTTTTTKKTTPKLPHERTGTRPNTRRQSRLTIDSHDTSALLPANSADDHLLADAAEKLVEPVAWAALAFKGFMFWASAGEQRSFGEAEEVAHDKSLLADLLRNVPTPAAPSLQSRPSGSVNVQGTGVVISDSLASPTAPRVGMRMDRFLGSAERHGHGGGVVVEQQQQQQQQQQEEDERARAELGILTFFHRLTANILGTLADVVAAVSEDDKYEEETNHSQRPPSRTPLLNDVNGETSLRGEPRRRTDLDQHTGLTRAAVRVDSDTLAAMGLDVWSSADASFVRDVVDRYFARQTRVEGKRLEVCGFRVI